jgi:hypothetical protein
LHDEHAWCVLVLTWEPTSLSNLLNTLVLQQGAALPGCRKHV